MGTENKAVEIKTWIKKPDTKKSLKQNEFNSIYVCLVYQCIRVILVKSSNFFRA